MTTLAMMWHVRSLKFEHTSLKRKRAELARLTKALERQEKEFFQYAAQIVKAKKLGKAGFDKERFMKKRVKK